MAKKKEVNLSPELDKIENENTEIQANENNDVFYPYSENVQDKDYTNVDPIIKGMGDNFEVPEFIPERPVIDLNNGASEEKKETNQQVQPQQTNQQENKLNKKNAQRLAEMCIGAYEQLKTWMYYAANLDETRLEKMAIKGKFDMNVLNLELPISETETITVKEYLQDYERSLKRALNLEEDNRSHLEPELRQMLIDNLTAILEKRGYGASPEMQFAFLLGMDFLESSVQVLSLRAMTGKLLKALSEQVKTNNAPAQPINQAPVQPIQPQTTIPQPQPMTYEQQIQSSVYGTNTPQTIVSYGAVEPKKRGRKAGQKDLTPRKKREKPSKSRPRKSSLENSNEA